MLVIGNSSPCSRRSSVSRSYIDKMRSGTGRRSISGRTTHWNPLTRTGQRSGGQSSYYSRGYSGAPSGSHVIDIRGSAPRRRKQCCCSVGVILCSMFAIVLTIVVGYIAYQKYYLKKATSSPNTTRVPAKQSAPVRRPPVKWDNLGRSKVTESGTKLHDHHYCTPKIKKPGTCKAYTPAKQDPKRKHLAPPPMPKKTERVHPNVRNAIWFANKVDEATEKVVQNVKTGKFENNYGKFGGNNGISVCPECGRRNKAKRDCRKFGCLLCSYKGEQDVRPTDGAKKCKDGSYKRP